MLNAVSRAILLRLDIKCKIKGLYYLKNFVVPAESTWASVFVQALQVAYGPLYYLLGITYGVQLSSFIPT